MKDIMYVELFAMENGMPSWTGWEINKSTEAIKQCCQGRGS